MRAQERELGLRVVPGYLAPAFAPDPVIEGLWWERVPTPAQLRSQPGLKRGDDAFLRDVTERATAVLKQANSWAELQRGLAEEGLSIRVKGGGFRITDSRHDVKASQVGREFSRRQLEKRFGPYPDYRARMAVAESTLALRSPADVVAPEAEPPTPTISSRDAAGSADAPQPRAREPRCAQFGDAGHGITELFGSPEPRERDRLDEVQRSRATDGPKHVPAPVIGTPADLPRLPALPVSLPTPVSTAATNDVQRTTRDVRRPQFGDAGQGISELFGSMQEPERREAESADVLPTVEAAQQPAHSVMLTPMPGQSHARVLTGGADRRQVEPPLTAPLALVPPPPTASESVTLSLEPAVPAREPVAPAPEPVVPSQPVVAPEPVGEPEPHQPPRVREPTRIPEPQKPIISAPAPDAHAWTPRTPLEVARYEVVVAFARLYDDFQAAWLTFERDLERRGANLVLHTLETQPATYGRLLPGARQTDAVAAADALRAEQQESLREWVEAKLDSVAQRLRAVIDAADAADQVVADARAALNAAKAASRNLEDKRELAKYARTQFVEPLRSVYRRPGTAERVGDVLLESARDEASLDTSKHLLRELPEQLGELHPHEESAGNPFEQFREARRNAAALVDHLDAAARARWRVPTAEEFAKAAEDVRKAQAVSDAALRTRAESSDVSRQSLIKAAARELSPLVSVMGRDEIERRLGRKLPSTSVSVLRETLTTAVSLAEGPQPKRRRRGVEL